MGGTNSSPERDMFFLLTNRPMRLQHHSVVSPLALRVVAIGSTCAAQLITLAVFACTPMTSPLALRLQRCWRDALSLFPHPGPGTLAGPCSGEAYCVAVEVR